MPHGRQARPSIPRRASSCNADIDIVGAGLRRERRARRACANGYNVLFPASARENSDSLRADKEEQRLRGYLTNAATVRASPSRTRTPAERRSRCAKTTSPNSAAARRRHREDEEKAAEHQRGQAQQRTSPGQDSTAPCCSARRWSTAGMPTSRKRALRRHALLVAGERRRPAVSVGPDRHHGDRTGASS